MVLFGRSVQTSHKGQVSSEPRQNNHSKNVFVMLKAVYRVKSHFDAVLTFVQGGRRCIPSVGRHKVHAAAVGAEDMYHPHQCNNSLAVLKMHKQCAKAGVHAVNALVLGKQSVAYVSRCINTCEMKVA